MIIKDLLLTRGCEFEIYQQSPRCWRARAGKHTIFPICKECLIYKKRKKIKHIIGEVFILTHKLFNLQFEEEIKILATLNQLFCESHILWQA